MITKVRINLANQQELLEIEGLTAGHADAIVRFRSEHGPIGDPDQLARVLGERTLAGALLARVDFSPSDTTAPEAPGA